MKTRYYMKKIEKLMEDDKILKDYMEDSTEVSRMNSEYYDDEMKNFKIKKLGDRKYFEFDIVDPVTRKRNVKIQGNILRSQNILSLIYVEKVNPDIKDEKSESISMKKIVQISDNISLHEASLVSTNLKRKFTPSVWIEVDNKEEEKEEIYYIGFFSQIYRLYKKGKIDAVELCNFAFTQADTNEETKIDENDNGLEKILTRRFSPKRK